jgi:hypothetical protein
MYCKPDVQSLLFHACYTLPIDNFPLFIIPIHFRGLIQTIGRLVRFEVFTAATMKNAVFLDVMPRCSCDSRRFGGKYCFNHQGDKNGLARNSVSS